MWLLWNYSNNVGPSYRFFGKYSLREISSFFAKFDYYSNSKIKKEKNDDKAIEDKLPLMHYEIASILRKINTRKELERNNNTSQITKD